MGKEAGLDQAAAERRFRFELAAHPGSPARARRLARARLTGWSVCEDTCDTAALVISELVTNAIVHTASGVVVCELYDGDDLVRIAVRDEGCAPGEPHPSPQRPEEEHGRGLFLVDALSHSWGAQEHGPGLLVWADLPRRAASEDSGHLAAQDASAVSDADQAPAPRADLGWGARPKPDPAGGSDDEGEVPTEHSDHTDARHTDARHAGARLEDARHAGAGHGDLRHGDARHGHPVHGDLRHGHDAHGGSEPAEQAHGTHPAESRAEARALGQTHWPHRAPATDGRADPRPGGPLGRLPHPSDGLLPRVAPQWHRGPGTAEPPRPTDRTDHALDTTSGTPAPRPHPGAGSAGFPPRGRDTA